MFERRLEVLLQNQDKIKSTWFENDSVSELFEQHGVDKKQFENTYASSMIDTYLKIASGDAHLSSCILLDDLIEYLKQKDFKAADFFVVCTTFRDSIIETAYDFDVANKDFVSKISKIFTQNFSMILSKYFFALKDIEDELTRTNNFVEKHTFVSKTDKNGVITYVSNAFCELSGYSPDELLGNTHAIVRHPETPQSIYDEMWQALGSGRSFESEMRLLTKNGKTYWIDLMIEPIIDKMSNEIIGYKAIRENITSQKELIQQQNLLIEQSKSAAMGEMISMIAHQWRQPLQAVSILVQKLPITKMAEGDLSDELIDQTVDAVTLQLDYMSKTIDDFRDFFRPGKGKDVVEAKRIVDKSVEFLHPIFKNNSVELEVFGDDNTKVCTHFNEFVQVLINIMKNAVDVMKERDIKERKIQIKYKIENKNFVMKLSDNAGGIPTDVIEKIFDPYFSTKSNKNGTGLGLYMSKTIIEKHCGGLIFAKNDANGAVFTIMMPQFENTTES